MAEPIRYSIGPNSNNDIDSLDISTPFVNKFERPIIEKVEEPVEELYVPEEPVVEEIIEEPIEKPVIEDTVEESTITEESAIVSEPIETKNEPVGKKIDFLFYTEVNHFQSNQKKREEKEKKSSQIQGQFR